MYVCMYVILVTTFSCNICLHRMTIHCFSGERIIKLLQLNTHTAIYCKRATEPSIVTTCKASDVRLPELSRAKSGENIPGIPSTD